MTPDIQLTAKQKRRMYRILTGKRMSLAEAAKIGVYPLCHVYEGDPAYKEPDDDRTNILRRDPREEKQ